MFKLITLLKRRPGMSVADFRDYYERQHRMIGEKYLSGHAHHYVRRYVDPLPGQGEPAHDVVMEIWLDDADAYARLLERLGDPATMAEIVEDEEKLFDRSAAISFTVTEFESKLGQT